jgi:hypothetical protein
MIVLAALVSGCDQLASETAAPSIESTPAPTPTPTPSPKVGYRSKADCELMVLLIPRESSLYGRTEAEMPPPTNLRGCNLDGALLSGDYLLRGDFSETSMYYADLQDTTIGAANFSGAILTGANFANSSIAFANFEGAILKNANLFGAIAIDTNFSYANLCGANVSGAILQGADFTGAIMPDCTVHP